MFSSKSVNDTQLRRLWRSPKLRQFLIKDCSILLLFSALINPAQASDFPKLDEAIPGDFVSKYAPVFDFDGDGCLPSAGISRSGEMNGGLKPTGKIGGDCRSGNFLDTSNTLHRYACTYANSSKYCGHFYALYFEKDQAVNYLGGGHRHDWEYAAIWTKDGGITHGSISAHGKMNTRAKSELPLDENDHMKVVYHKDGLKDGLTHALRFAGKQDDSAENPYGRFVTPTIASWCSLTGDGISNRDMRVKLNNFDYNKANLPIIKKSFIKELNEFKPSGYPTFKSGPDGDLTSCR